MSESSLVPSLLTAIQFLDCEDEARVQDLQQRIEEALPMVSVSPDSWTMMCSFSWSWSSRSAFSAIRAMNRCYKGRRHNALTLYHRREGQYLERVEVVLQSDELFC